MFKKLFTEYMDEPFEKLYANIIIIIVFWLVYMYLDNTYPDSFAKQKGMTKLDWLYYTVIVHTTVGFGDIYPTNTMSRLVVVSHTLLVWWINFIQPGLFSI